MSTGLKLLHLIALPLAAALAFFIIGCTPSASGVDAMPSPKPDIGVTPAVDASVDRPFLPDAGPVDLPDELKPDTQTDVRSDAQADVLSDGQMDAPSELPPGFAPSTPWPAPGTAYLTKLATQADYDQLLGAGQSLPFIIRRRANDHTYPYPWDRYECVFEPPGLHVDFLQRVDAERAVFLYYSEAKRPEGTLIPGQASLDKTRTPNVMRVHFENFRNLIGTPAVFPLEPAVIPLIRERITRCISFTTSFTFSMSCPDGRDCPLP